MKDSSITITDQFCGAGGSSIGARKVLEKRGGKVAVALNHWKLAIDTHNTNFPETIHDCTDLSACDPRRYPSTTGLITSPECTNHTVANGKKYVSAQLDLFSKGILDPAAERSRATMWDVPRFAEFHKYEFIIVENVVDARKWIQFPAWLMSMDLLGYKHKAVYANSMHFQPTPQSRDRMYVVFWKKGNKSPDLELRPKAYCSNCSNVVESVQAWKNPSAKYGKYKQQYIYVCPTCVSKVEPYYHAAFNIIDWNNKGTKISDRKKPLSPNSERRIKYGLNKYDSSPLIIKGEHTLVEGMVKSVDETLHTQCTRQTMSLCVPFIINNQQSTGVSFRVKSSEDVLPTQSTQQSFSLAVPAPFMVENKGKSNARSILDPAATMTTVNHLGIITNESWRSFIDYHYGQMTSSSITDALGTATTKDRHSLVSFETPRYEDCYYRMLTAMEVQLGMAFDKDYIILGSSKDKVKQCGNAVTPPAMEWLVNRCVESLEN